MRILIIGGDAAGMSAASQIKRRQKNWTVEAFEMGNYTSYGLCGIPYYLGGVIKDFNNLISISPEEFREKRNIKVHTLHKVTKINRKDKTIEVTDLKTGKSKTEKYDKLVIATGAGPLILPGLNAESIKGAYYLHTLEETKKIKEHLKTAKSAAVIGAGYIGLETIEAFRELGLKTTLIGRRPAPIFEPEIQAMVANEMAQNEVTFLAETDATEILQDKSGAVLIKTNKNIDVIADVVVVATGVVPRSQLAEDAGLKLGPKKAIAVNEWQQTSDPDIYAAGDCAQSYHLVTKKPTHIALALGANRQGKVAGLNISGTEAKFPGVLGTSILKTFNLALARTGLGLKEAQDNGFTDAYKTQVRQASKPGYYPGSSVVTLFVIHDTKTRKLLGAQMVGTMDGVGARINTFAAALAGNFTIEQLASLDTAYAPPFAPVQDPVIIAAEVAAKN